MAKIDSIVDFSLILNRGYASKTLCKYFETVNHPQLLSTFIDFVNINQNLIGLTKIESHQSINDNGCDVYIELRGEAKIGVQIKSKSDVEETNFANKVKAQYSDSFALGLDKYYILICSPIDSSTEGKINYIISQMAIYKTNYHAVLNPNNCLKIFNPGGEIPEEEFAFLKQLFSKEENPDNIKAILQSIKMSLSPTQKIHSEFGVGLNNAIYRPLFQKIDSAKKFIKFLQLDKNIKESEVIDEMNEIIIKIGKLSLELRKFYYFIIRESEEVSHFIDALEMNLFELESVIATDSGTLMSKLKILASPKYQLIDLDEDEPDIAQIFVCLPGDYNFMKELRSFCELNSIKLEDILVAGDFSLLD